MSESRPENDCGLIIEQALLVDIRAQCLQRRRELEAAGTLPAATIAPRSLQSVPAALPAPSSIPALPSLPASWWEALFRGNREGVLSIQEANIALQLIAGELGEPLRKEPFSREDIVRVHTLRELLSARAGAWEAVASLWQAVGGPQPGLGPTSSGPLPGGALWTISLEFVS
jgi:hypothetical protein